MLIRTNKQPSTLLERAEGDSSIGTLTGYIAVFDSDSVEIDGYIEQIKPGAFGDSMTKNDVVCLLNHEATLPLGRVSAGNFTLQEDEVGLAYRLEIPDTNHGRDLKTLAEQKILLGCSFGFQIEKETWTRKDGKDLCILEQIDLYECSVGVSFPAYPSTTMEIRSRLKSHRERIRSRDQKKLKMMRLYNSL